tara:strand:- start:2332 stop:3090 length:759 start_codon:yes stop_codon:yes gene_type:complete
MNNTIIINWLKTTSLSISEISIKTGISRNTIHSWINGSSPRRSNVNRVYREYKKYIEIENKGTDKMNDSIDRGDSTDTYKNQLIDLQNEKIKRQSKIIEQLKNDASQKEVTHWDALDYDFTTDVSLTRNGIRMGRTIDDVTNLKKQSEVLGYSKEKLLSAWDIGTPYVKMEIHPINEIIAKETMEEVSKQSITLPIVFDSFKKMIGSHFIPMPIMYIHKNGNIINAISYNKVEWSLLKVKSKIKFLLPKATS